MKNIAALTKEYQQLVLKPSLTKAEGKRMGKLRRALKNPLPVHLPQ